MKKITVIVICSLMTVAAHAQESMTQAMEKRAREMHRVMTLSDKSQWRKFVQENFSQALIDKPMRAQVATSDNTGSSTEKKEIPSNLDAKVGMLERFHEDFGDSKISSIKTDGDRLTMQLITMDLAGKFTLTFNKTKPYLIEGLAIEADGNR